MTTIPCENLWLDDAAALWARMNAPSAWDTHTDDLVLAFVDRFDLAWQIIARWLRVDDGDEDRAEDLFWDLPVKTRVALAEACIDGDSCLVADYNTWMKEVR